MSSALRWVALAFSWGVLAGTFFGLARVAAEGYLEVGLPLLTVRVLLDAILAYVPAALLGGLLATPVGLATRAFAERLGGFGAGGSELASWLAVSLPVWPCLALADSWLLPPGRMALATLGALVLLHLLASFAWSRRDSRYDAGLPVWSAAAASLGLVAALGGARLLLPLSHANADRPDLLIVVLDTVRADRLSSYGYERDTTPEIDAFARDAIRFTNFYSTSSWTVPSHASLFTGLFPLAHRATQTNVELARHHTTLAELLLEEGYQTWAASGNPFVGPETKLDQGFETFVQTWSQQADEPAARPAEHRAVEAFRTFLGEATRDDPFFAFVNLIEAHSPYVPPAELERRFLRRVPGVVQGFRLANKPWTDHFVGEPFSKDELEILSDLYDGEVAYASQIFHELLKTLRADGRFDDTWIVLTSDHGEHFGENGLIEHMFTLYNTAVRVPLIVRPPGGTGRPRVDDRPAQLIDLFAAVIAALDVGHAPAHHGVDLLADDHRRELVFSEYHYPSQVLGVFHPADLEAHPSRIGPHRRTLLALQRGDLRFIWSSDGRHELYDLSNDPGETRNLYDPETPSKGGAELRARLEEIAGRAPTELIKDPSMPELSTEAEEALRALGYVP